MFNLKFVAYRLGMFCLAYLGFWAIFQFSAVQKRSNFLFSKGTEKVLSTTLPQGFIHVEPTEKALKKVPDGEKNTIRVLFGNKSMVEKAKKTAQKSGQSDANVQLKDYKVKATEFFVTPLIFFFALLVVTPTSFLKKLKVFAVGTLLILLFSWLKLLLFTLHQYQLFPQGVYEWSGFKVTFLAAVYENLRVGISFLVATLVWAMLMASDLQHFATNLRAR